VRRRELFGLGASAIAGLAFARRSAEAKAFTDSAGRRIELPEEIAGFFLPDRRLRSRSLR